MSRAVRILTENSAKAVQGSYLAKEYDDIINPKPVKELRKGDATEGIRSKLRK